MTNSLSFSVSLIFYEEVKDINICHALHTLQKMYTTEVEVVGGASSIRRTRNEQRPRSSQVFPLFLQLFTTWFHEFPNPQFLRKNHQILYMFVLAKKTPKVWLRAAERICLQLS